MSAENPSRLSMTSSLSSSKFEPISSTSSSLRTTPTPQTTNTSTRMLVEKIFVFPMKNHPLYEFRSNRGVTLYQCIADNDSELSFNANEIVTQGKDKVFLSNFFALGLSV